MISAARNDINKRMLQLMEYYLSNHKDFTETAYLERIGFSRYNINNVRSSRQSFTLDHVREACLFTGADANWILGLPKSKMLRNTVSSSPIDRIEEAVQELKSSLGASSLKKKR